VDRQVVLAHSLGQDIHDSPGVVFSGYPDHEVVRIADHKCFSLQAGANFNSRLKRALAALSEWCRMNLHAPIKEQHQKLVQKLRGHYGYYGIIGNLYSLLEFREGARRIWRRKLSRRRRDGDVTWAQFLRLEKHYNLPRARVVHGLLSRVAKS
jgi:hypothetical protein